MAEAPGPRKDAELADILGSDEELIERAKLVLVGLVAAMKAFPSPSTARSTEPSTEPSIDPSNSVVVRAIDVIGDREEALRWMGTPVRALGYSTPVSLLGKPDGQARVMAVLTQLEHGVF
jgi:Antitoxin Xre/MbcA/ParS C-terminal toxin-binding domain